MKTQYILLLLLCAFEAFDLQSQDKAKISYPYETKEIQLGDSLNIVYADEGKGKDTLIFIHGLGSYLPVWKPNIDTLKAHNRCIALDLPGYGKSSKGGFEYSMSFFAETLHGLMENLKIEKATFVGHSMGGQIAITFALKYPEKVNKLILIAPAGFETFKAEQIQLMESFSTSEQIKNTPNQKIKSNMEVNFYDMPPTAEFMIQDRINMKEESDFSKYTQAVSKSVTGMLEEPVFERLNDIQAPTMIIFGKEDKLIPNKFFNAQLSTSQVAQAGSQKIKNAQLHLIDKAGHLVNFEKAQLVNDFILAFIAQ